MLFFFIAWLWVCWLGFMFGGEGIACLGFMAALLMSYATIGGETTLMCLFGSLALFVAVNAAGKFAHWFFHERRSPLLLSQRTARTSRRTS